MVVFNRALPPRTEETKQNKTIIPKCERGGTVLLTHKEKLIRLMAQHL